MSLLGSRSVFGGLVALLGLCACGGVSRLDPNGRGDETAGSPSGGADSAGRSGDEVAGRNGVAGASVGGTSSAGASAGGASACLPFRDQPPQPVTVTITNDTSDPVYLGSRMQTCGLPPLYEVLDGSNAALPGPGSCGNPCQGWIEGNPIGGCPAICAYPQATELAAGESIVTQWAGLYVVQAQLPKQCDPSQLSGEGAVTCSVNTRIEPGTYGFRASAGSNYQCTLPGDCGACVPSATGGCTLNGAIVTGTENIAQLVVELDASYGIRGSTGEHDNDDVGQLQKIELVFRRPL
ncbi:MAG: hypothetical protein ABW061_09635 [Polyangiaceae bacterium]